MILKYKMEAQMRCYFSLTFLIFLLIPIVGRAQQAFDLQELIHLALKQNADVRVQQAQTRMSGLERRQAISNLLPTLDAEGGYIYSTYRNGSPDFVGANGQKEALAYLSLHQPIFNADDWGRLRQSALEQKKQNVLFRKTRQEVILQVIESYFNSLMLRGEEKVLQENLHSFKLMYEQSQMLFEAGSVPEIDVKKSHVEFLLQGNSLRMSQKDYLGAINHLKELVGFSLSDSLKIKDFRPQKSHIDNLNIYKKAALQNNPEWQALQFEYKQASVQRQTMLFKNLPSAEANLFYGWDANPPLSRNNNGWQAMLTVSMPLWHWGAQKADYQIATLHLNQIEQTQSKIKKQILQQVINAYHEARLQQAQIEAMREGKSEAGQAVKMARIGYREGSITNLELINTQKIFTRAQIGYLAAWYNFYTAKASLLRNAGMLTEDLGWIE